MNDKSIVQLKDADSRGSQTALYRATVRAREPAQRTGTRLVLSRAGSVQYIVPERTHVTESHASCGKRK